MPCGVMRCSYTVAWYYYLFPPSTPLIEHTVVTARAQSQHGHGPSTGTVTARSQTSHSAVTAQSQHSHSAPTCSRPIIRLAPSIKVVTNAGTSISLSSWLRYVLRSACASQAKISQNQGGHRGKQGETDPSRGVNVIERRERNRSSGQTGLPSRRAPSGRRQFGSQRPSGAPSTSAPAGPEGKWVPYWVLGIGHALR